MNVCNKNENVIMSYTGKTNQIRLHMNLEQSYLNLPTEQNHYTDM